MDNLVMKIESLKEDVIKLADEFPHFLNKTLVREMGGKELSKVAKQQSSELLKIVKKISTQTNKLLGEAKKLPNQPSSRPPKPLGKVPVPDDLSVFKSEEETMYDDGKSPESAYNAGSSTTKQEPTYDDGTSGRQDETYDDGTSAKPEETYDDGTSARPEETYDDGTSAKQEETYDDGMSGNIISTNDFERSVKGNVGTAEEEVHTGSSGVSKLSSGSSMSNSPLTNPVPKTKPYILKEKAIKASDIKNPTHHGLLQKMKPHSEKKKGGPKFQMRYFVLKDQKMYYYDSNVKNRKKQKKCISLEGFSVRQDVKLKTRFWLSRPEVRTFLLVASTEDECLTWINKLKESCAVLRTESDDTGEETYEKVEEETLSVPASEEIYEEMEGSVIAEAKKAYTSSTLAPVPSDPVEETYDDVQNISKTTESVQELSNEEIIEQYKALLEQGLVKHEELYYASWSSTADHRQELSVRQGQMLRLLDRERYGAVGWWVCEANGCRGLVPHSYLQAAFELVH